MTAPIQVVLFDFGGVIAPLAADDTVARLEADLQIAPGRLHASMYEGDLWPELSVGKLTEEEYWQALGSLLGREPAGLRQALVSIWEPRILDDGVVELARCLHGHVRVAILSNATLQLETHLQALRIHELFDPVINSARVGLRKPDPAVFLHALERLDVPAGSVLFIDDKERNTVVAEELGIPSIRFESAEQLRDALARYDLLAWRDERSG